MSLKNIEFNGLVQFCLEHGRKMSNKRRDFTLQRKRLTEKCYDKEKKKNGRTGIYVNVGEINLSRTKKMKKKNPTKHKMSKLDILFSKWLTITISASNVIAKDTKWT